MSTLLFFVVILLVIVLLILRSQREHYEFGNEVMQYRHNRNVDASGSDDRGDLVAAVAELDTLLQNADENDIREYVPTLERVRDVLSNRLWKA